MQKSFFLISGPCVIESRELVFDVAGKLKELCLEKNIPLIFKASFDKANRTSGSSFRGLGKEASLKILQDVKKELGVQVITDIHAVEGLDEIADVVDMLQIPAFLSRQTDLIYAAAQTGLELNIKKGQFMAPNDMHHVYQKAREKTKSKVYLCERGTTFGYHNLVVDFRSLEIMRQVAPVVFDATHSVQLPGAGNGQSLGQRHFVPLLARAAVAAGIDGLFMETHPEPENALSDGPNAWPLDKMSDLLDQLLNLHEVSSQRVVR